MVQVLTKGPSCVQCTATTRKLKALGVEFVEIEFDDEKVAWAKEMGYSQAPLVIGPDGEMFSGFDPDRLEKFAA